MLACIVFVSNGEGQSRLLHKYILKSEKLPTKFEHQFIDPQIGHTRLKIRLNSRERSETQFSIFSY